MSLGVVVKGPEGVVLAADSRVTFVARMNASIHAAGAEPTLAALPVTFDNATRLLTFRPFQGEDKARIAAVTYGAAVIGQTENDLRTAHSLISEFELEKVKAVSYDVREFSQLLSEFFAEKWAARMPTGSVESMSFLVAGYDRNSPYGAVYLFKVPDSLEPVEQSPNSFGITFGGQIECIARLLMGYEPRLIDIVCEALSLSTEQRETLLAALAPLRLQIPWGILPLQDCINLCIYLIRTTMAAQDLSITIRGVGGGIDVAAITPRDGVIPIQRKQLFGENSK